MKINPDNQPPHAERTNESKKLTKPTPAAGQRSRPPPLLKSRSPAIMTSAKGPGEFKVLNTRTSNGAGEPTEVMPALVIHSWSQSGGSKNCSRPYRPMAKTPQTKVRWTARRKRG